MRNLLKTLIREAKRDLIRESFDVLFEQYEDTGFSRGGHWGDEGSGIVMHTGRKILLMRRSSKVNEPNTWGIPGGAIPIDVETGELRDPWESAVQETREECGGLPPRFPSRPDKTIINQVSDDFKFHNFIIKLPREAETWRPILNWESDDAKWFEIKELPNNLHPGVEWLLRKTNSA